MNQFPAHHPAAPVKPRHSIRRWLFALAGAGLLGLAGYSIYVAKHEPDPQETVILGQTRISAGSPAAFRILVRNRISGQPIAGAAVVLQLAGPAGPAVKLGAFRTDAAGCLADPVDIPKLAPGDYQLIVDTQSSVGRDHLVQKVELRDPALVFLISDKPLYQPGQTLHLRTLTLNAQTQKPLAGQPVTFEVSDPKGNKVFKETRAASAFGIAAADFTLADEVNLGRYEIRALAGSATGERTVEVKPYVLPKFKIQIATAKPYYLPGQTVAGTVQTAYFFGKPVAGGAVKLTAATLQEQPVTLATVNGRTDAQGGCAFQFVLPDFLAGLPQNNGQALLDLTAEVTDTAGHVETKTRSLSVAQNELNLTAIPEAGGFVPGVDNLLYVLAAYPDGRPAVCSVTVDGAVHSTDAQGVCAVTVRPPSAGWQYEILAVDAAGRSRQIKFAAAADTNGPALLLRTDQAIYQAGQTVQVSLLSPDQDNTVFLDVIKNGQTVLTKSVALSHHQAAYRFNLPATLVGALQLNAYVITAAGEDRGCSRLIYVNPASGLQIAARVSRPVYRPGETARLDFTVTDAAGQPAPAALGIAAVDESVFALAESRPGLLQQFLDVEADLLKPRYQIKAFDSPASLVEGGNQILAQAYLASLAQAPAGLPLDDMVQSGTLSPKIIEHLRDLRGTPAYEALRNDPRYGPTLRMVETGGGRYSLRVFTGPDKQHMVEAHRKAYFDRLKSAFVTVFLGAVFLLPILLIARGSRPDASVFTGALDTEASRKYVELAESTREIMGALTLYPILFYPLGAYMLAGWEIRNPGGMLLAGEMVLVCAVLAWQQSRIARAGSALPPDELQPFSVFLGAFLSQFLVSRLTIALANSSHMESAGFFLPWGVASLIAPLVVLAWFGTQVRGQYARRNLSVPQKGITVVGVLLIVAMFMILAAMMLPALAASKRKAQKISLMNDLKQVEIAQQIMEEDNPKSGGGPQPRVRRDFPETLCWRPELITDDRGRASLEIPLADSITTWRTSVDGVSAAGKLGSVEVPITVFQDFFADLDLPVSLSLNDQVAVPVTCYNYLKEPQDVRLALAPDAWFESSPSELVVHLGAGEVQSAKFSLKAVRVGGHTLRVTAHGGKMADALEREVRVLPVGEKIEHTENGVLQNTAAGTFNLPTAAIPDSASLSLKFYPSRFSEIVEGLDSIFGEPYGCFEQTSSVTYPNVLALDYLKRVGRLTPETEVRARKLINTGYQRLLTFEVPGGGFEWFGRDPAHVGLTAYGILEFTDMNRVQPVDPAMIERTRNWLYSKQNANGSWDTGPGLDAWPGISPVTAYVAWALAESGDTSAALQRGLDYLRAHPETLAGNYQKALAANAFLAFDPHDAFGRELLDQLQKTAIADNHQLHWSSTGYGAIYSHGAGLDTECTALCAMALMKSGTAPQSVKQALTWLSKEKTARGTWGSTQATILAMRALIAGSTAALGQEFESSITVLLNGQTVETFRINKTNSDVMKQIPLTKRLQPGENRLELRQTPAGELPFQIAGAYWLPDGPRPAAATPEALQIDVRYDRGTLAVNDRLQCYVTVANHSGVRVNMAIVDLGIPPGFDVDPAAFETMKQNGQVAKYETTGNQVILYLRELSETAPFEFAYSLRAKYPLRVQSPPSTVYEYYQPANRAQSRPVALQVAGPL